MIAKRTQPLLLIGFVCGMLSFFESLYSLRGIEANTRVVVSNNFKARETTACPEDPERSKAVGRAKCRSNSSLGVNKISTDRIRLDDDYRRNDIGESEEKR